MKQKRYLKFRRPIYKIISCSILLNFPFVISLALADEYKSQIRSENFKEVYLKDDIKYEYVDSYDNQFNLFFGIDNSLVKRSFRDLAFPLSSRSIRKLYNEKLKQMSLKENSHLKEVFFDGRL